MTGDPGPGTDGDSPAGASSIDTPTAALSGRGSGSWHARSTGVRRTVRTAVVLLVTGVLAFAVGITTASYAGSIGPHAARYWTTLNSEVTVDMGPLGALIVDSPLPAGLGVDVVVQEIPAELTAASSNPIAGLSTDIASYTQFLANPGASITEAANGLVRDALGRAVLTWSLLLAVVALGRLASHGELRSAAKGALRQPGVPYLAIGVVAALVVPVAVTMTEGSGGEGRTSLVLAGTPLADARITGRLGTIVDYYGGQVVEVIQENEDFYEDVRRNLVAAFEADAEAFAPAGVPPMTATLAPEEIVTPRPDPDADASTPQPQDDATADVSPPAAAAEPAEDPSLPEPDPATMLVISDLHCNIGMAPVLGAAAELSRADVVVNGGDTTVSGTSVESVCVNAFADGIGPDVPVVVADGNHDSIRTTGEQERTRGWVVLAGQPVDVAGITFLGDSDPTLTSLGGGTQPQRSETLDQLGQRLGAVACERVEQGDPIDVLLVHNPRAALGPLATGCVPLSISGHVHRRIGPWQQRLGIQYVSASTAGAASNAPTIGPLNAAATMTLIRWDRANDEPMDFRIITIDTDAVVDLGRWESFPPPPSELMVMSEPEPGEAPWSDPQDDGVS